MKITVLGTSSAIPTFKRALSGTLLEREGECYLFDCGEGTQFQLMRAGARRGKLRSIFITHLHGDHFYGLPGLLSSFNLNRREQPLTIYGPTGLARYVDFMLSFPKKLSYTYDVTVKEIPNGYTGTIFEGDEVVVRTRPLDHRVPTQGYRFEEKPRPGAFDAERADALGVPFGPERGLLQRGESIVVDGRTITPDEIVGPPRPGKVFVYCTDTGFCLEAKRLAQDCDLLLHESTYSDAMMQLAFERKHATIRQAAAVARGANAKRFVATHFSTRYDRDSIGQLEKEGREVFPDLVMATDLMSLEF